VDELKDLHPLVQKGIKEGRIDPRDAKWLSEYASTPGSPKVETGKKYPDLSEKMENYVNRVKAGQATGEGFKENKLELGGSRGGGGSGIPKSSKHEPLKFSKGGKVTTASKRADGCCIKGKTKGRIV
jgi:hypothetical protein